MKILLVEDSATLRYAMRNYIIEAGHTPLIAQSGEEALQMLETTPVDMIIMDVEMPGLNGFETTRLIREWLGGHWIPIIFVTGRNEDESYREGIEAPHQARERHDHQSQDSRHGTHYGDARPTQPAERRAGSAKPA